VSKRNNIAHGVWRRLSDGCFEVQPLRTEEGKIYPPIVVNIASLQQLLVLLRNLSQQFASLAAEIMAAKALEKIAERSRRS
jgi:hypothetical protein